MSMMGMFTGWFFYVCLSFVFMISITSIFYELSPYSRTDSDTRLSGWELKTLYSFAGYPPLSLLLLVVFTFITDELTGFNLTILLWFCTAHLIISVLGAAGASYLRRRNSRNSLYYFSDLLAGCIYACCLLAFFFGMYQ